MSDKIEVIRKTRSYLLTSIQDLTTDQLNVIPAGFNNNIIWHLGHLVASQQGVCYVRAGMKPRTSEEFFNTYKPGSKPEEKISQQEIQNIKELLISSLDILQQDYEQGLWTTYTAWSTRYGLELTSIDEALNFLQFHEGLHAGYILAIKKIV